MKNADKRKIRVVLTRITEDWPEADYMTTPWSLSLGLHYIKEYCLSDPRIEPHVDITVKTFHLQESAESIVRELTKMRPDILGFSCYVTGYPAAVSVAAKVKIKSPETFIVFGGPHAFDAEAELMRHAFLDAAIPYEGEAPFKEMLLCRLQGSPPDAVKGIAVRRSGEIVYTGDRKAAFDVSELPVIFTESFVRGMSGSIIYESSRGCKYSCGYCAYANQKYREFPMERVKSELRTILGRDEIKQIIFADLDIANNPDRFNEILDFVMSVRRKIQLSGFWSSTGKILECAKKMKQAGFIRGFTVSLQSGDKNVLKQCGRSWLTLEHIEKITPEILEYFPESRVQLILGLPGETLATFKKTHLDLYMLGYKVFHVADFMVTPGARFYRQRTALGLEYIDDGSYILKKSPCLSEKELQLCRDFSVNFQVLALLFPREYVRLYEQWGIDLVQLASAMPPMTKYCASASESGAVYNLITEAAIEDTSGFIKRKYRFGEKKSELIKEFLRLEYVIFRFERLQREEAGSEAGPLAMPLINKYVPVSVSTEICELLGLKANPAPDGRGRTTLYVLYNRKTRRAVPTTAVDENVYSQLLDIARGTSSVRELLKDFDPDSRKKALQLIVRLADEGFTSLNSAKDITFGTKG